MPLPSPGPTPTPGTSQSGLLANPLPAAPLLPPGATSTTFPGAGGSPLPASGGIAGLSDWQAALALYLVCLWTAEVEALSPIAVAVAWSTAVVMFFKVNPVALLQNQMGQNTSQSQPTG